MIRPESFPTICDDCSGRDVWIIGVDEQRRRILIRCQTCGTESFVAVDDRRPSSEHGPRDRAADRKPRKLREPRKRR